MFITFRHRKKIQYALIIVTVLIQLILLLFFYNEYFNVNKLRELERRMSLSQQWNQTSFLSKQHLLDAQQSLGLYVQNPQKSHLEDYFHSIQQVVTILDSATKERDTLVRHSTIEGSGHLHLNQPDIHRLESLIDSLYKNPPRISIKAQPIDISPIEIETLSPEVSVQSEIIRDSTPPKGFFPRLKDAIQGNVIKSVDTVYITTVHQQVIDTTKLMNTIDSTLSSVNTHYTQELKKSQEQLVKLSQQNKKLFDVYNQLLQLSHQIIENYDLNSHSLNDQLFQSYEEQQSKNTLIRRYSILGLMLLSIIVLILMGFLIKMSFQFEKALRQANQEIESNLKFKNRIIGMLSHEVRAPLKIINLFVQRIMKKTDDAQILSQLSSIKFTNDSLLLQANQILALSKNEEQSESEVKTLFNLYEEINTISKIFEPYIEAAQNTLISENHIGKDIVVYSDRTKIHQLMINLLTNANKFTSQGAIKIIAHADKRPHNQIQLSVEITDEGVGIPAEDLERIFQPYTQSHQWHEMHNLGVGLGLHLCKEIVQSLQGDIHVKSNPHEGTSVHFILLLDQDNSIFES